MNDFRRPLYEEPPVDATRGATKRNLRAEKRREDFFEYALFPFLRDIPRHARLLEMGCGSGEFLEYLQKKGFERTVGIDISAERTAQARARGLPVQQADILSFLQANSEPIDAFIALDVLEHFTKEELYELAVRLHATLTPGGVLIVQTPNGAGLFPAHVAYGDFTHMTVFTPSSFRQLFSSVGFVDFSFRETGPVPRNVSGLLRKAAWRLVTSAANVVRMIECGKRESVWTENMICRCRKGCS